MIPDFKTYIKESLFGDMTNKGRGEVVKKEDDSINHLDRDGLYEYLINHYKTDKWYNPIQNSSEQDFITIPVFYWHGGDAYNLCYNFEDNKINKIVITHDLPQMSICSSLKKFFTITEHEISWCIITPKDGSEINNQFCIDVLDCLISCCLKKSYKLAIEKINLNESLFGNMTDKGRGETVKKEDDVNNLDFNEFAEYLRDKYEVCIPNPNNVFQIHVWYIGSGVDGVGKISIPIEKNNYNETQNMTNRMLMIKKDIRNDDTSIMPNKYIFRLYPRELQKVFGDKYDIDEANFTITPKDKVITNNVCIDVIDKLLDIVERPMLTKK